MLHLKKAQTRFRNYGVCRILKWEPSNVLSLGGVTVNSIISKTSLASDTVRIVTQTAKDHSSLASNFAPMTDVNLKLIQTFCLVARHRSFKRAAELTFRSQSAVSTQIKQLEEQLRFDLLQRTTRTVSLTRHGEHFLEASQEALQLVDKCIRNIHGSMESNRNRILVACSNSIGSSSFMKRVIGAYAQEHPEISIKLSIFPSSELGDVVQASKADFAIGPMVGTEDIDFTLIDDCPIIAVVPEEMVDNIVGTLTLKELSQLPLLLLDQSSSVRNMLDAELAILGHDLVPRFESPHPEMLLSMVSKGIGTAILTRAILPKDLPDNCQVLTIERTMVSQEIALMKRKGQILSPAATGLFQMMCECAKMDSV